MRTKNWIFLFLLLLGGTAPLFSKGTLQGAWSRTGASAAGDQVKEVLLFSGDFFSWTRFTAGSGAFIDTKGGSFSMHAGQLLFTYEFHSSDTVKVGLTEAWNWDSGPEGLNLSLGEMKSTGWQALESAETTSLTGVWLMGGRVAANGEESRRNTNVPRKTMKILTGTRFQWIAYNTETKQFMGTGGGTYTAKEGRYVEQLEFFSRDNKRVGMRLDFSFDASSGDWHHKGKSSAGEPMHEIWVRRME